MLNHLMGLGRTVRRCGLRRYETRFNAEDRLWIFQRIDGQWNRQTVESSKGLHIIVLFLIPAHCRMGDGLNDSSHIGVFKIVSGVYEHRHSTK